MPNKKCCHHIVQFSKRYEYPIDEKKETYICSHFSYDCPPFCVKFGIYHS